MADLSVSDVLRMPEAEARKRGLVEPGIKFVRNRIFWTAALVCDISALSLASAQMSIMQDEIFGPVCSVVKFKTEEEVLSIANDVAYGLGANVFTENTATAMRMAHASEAGSIWVNCAQQTEMNVPFGGFKQSGMGRELGQYALDSY
ncbi:hypothetical protein AGABI1DRAFT_130202, partial [Agaricus bisporus var. burnettii JB137-S8]